MSSITVQTQEGERVFPGYPELCAALRELERAIDKSNLEQARAYFALGEMLVKCYETIKEQDPQVTKKYIYDKAGVNSQKAKRSIRWYNALRDDADGSFDEKKFYSNAHHVAQEIEHGRMKGSVDDDGVPSVYSISKHMGHHGPSAKGTRSDAVRFSADPSGNEEDRTTDDDDDGFRVLDVLNALPSPTGEDLDELDELAGETSPKLEQPTLTPTVRPSVNPGASGAQMTIDFDLVAREGELRKSIEIVAAKLAQGRLDNAHAAGIDQRLQALVDYVNATIEEAVA